ncbi:MAG: GrpB family protein [Microbacterium sp.]|uniref:GrpB family protein n=1 Tax=Microbacterium sp. TaxID=51671 RepID=UPI003F99C11C
MTAELPLDEPVTVMDHDPRWASQAARAIEDVKRITRARDVEHIGSTAVPGLPAKPIIDLMADVALADHDAVARELTAAGFTDFGEISAERRYLARRAKPATNVHLIVSTSSLWADNLAFRDYLRSPWATGSPKGPTN